MNWIDRRVESGARCAWCDARAEVTFYWSFAPWDPRPLCLLHGEWMERKLVVRDSRRRHPSWRRRPS